MKKFLDKYPFKDLKTVERRNNDIPEPVIELSKKEDIDARFEELCQKFRHKEIDDYAETNRQDPQEKSFRRINKRSTTIMTQADHEPGVSMEESRRHKKAPVNESQEIEELDNHPSIERTISLHLKRNMSKEAYGSTLGNLLDENTLKLFDLNGNFPKDVVTDEQKNSYLFNRMAKNVDRMLEKWDSKKSGHKYEDDDFEKEKQNINRKYQEVKDNFFWLKIDTKYESLLKKLRAAILEKLNEFENQTLVTEALDEKSRLQTQTSNNTSTFRTLNSSRISLYNVPTVTTKQLLESTESSKSLISIPSSVKNIKGASSLQLQANRPSTASYNKSQLATTALNTSATEPEEKEYFKSLFYDFDFNKDSKKMDDIELQERINFESNLKWSLDKEDVFQKRRYQAKTQYTLEITSSNWNELGILDLVEKANMEYKRNHNRLNTLNKFANRDEITINELKFLADTSELLNSCIDKKFIQEAVDILDPELISNVKQLLKKQ